MEEEKKRVVNCAYVIDGKYHIIHYNSAIKKIYPDLEIGDVCYERLQGEDRPCKVCPLTTLKQEGLLYYNKMKKAWVDCMAAPLDLVAGQEDHVVICHTITEMREDQKEEALRLLADESKERDALTGLYTRDVFLQRTDAMLKGIKPAEYCMIALDIENFKLFNTMYGFAQGNDFLHYIGASLKAASNNIGFAGYMGEDDFAAFLPNKKSILEALEGRLRRYIDEHNKNTGFYPAIGIYVIDDLDASVEKLYDKASIAQTLLRGNHMSRLSWYDESMVLGMEESYRLLNGLKRGLAQNEFIFYLQPKCDMNDRRIVGLEALCRWQHPEKGILSPGTFIPKMERSGLITDLDCMIWEKVCRTIKNWIAEGRKIVPISVNVSRVDFFVLDVVNTFEELVKKYNIPKCYLEIEVTESAYAENELVVKRAIAGLRERGYVVSMDDFGSAYSSLNMLQSMSVDVLKFDMRFLQLDSETEERGVHILEAIIHLAQSLNFKIVAEGVESQKYEDILLERGCRYAQGYYYYRPMPVDAAEELLAVSAVGRI